MDSKRQRPEESASAEASPSAASPAASPEQVVLYSYWRSGASYRVRIALNLKGLAYEYRPVHLLKDGGHQFDAKYVALNPSKRVPTLLIDGLVLGQSAAIIEYLEETRPSPPPPSSGAAGDAAVASPAAGGGGGGGAEAAPAAAPSYALLPASAAARAVVRQMVNVISNDMQPLGNLLTMKKVGALAAGDAPAKDAAREAWAQFFLTAGLEALEALMAAHSGAHCVGDALSMADVFLVPQIFACRRFKVDLEPFPHVRRVCAAAEAHPAFALAHPSKQPDAEA